MSSSLQTPQDYVTLDEFNSRFDKVYEEFAKIDRKFEYLTELMIAGFDRLEAKIDAALAQAARREDHEVLKRRVDVLERAWIEKTSK